MAMDDTDMWGQRVHDAGTAPPPKTLRDEFAMAALTGLLNIPTWPEGIRNMGVAKASYELADAMLAARQQKDT